MSQIVPASKELTVGRTTGISTNKLDHVPQEYVGPEWEHRGRSISKWTGGGAQNSLQRGAGRVYIQATQAGWSHAIPMADLYQEKSRLMETIKKNTHFFLKAFKKIYANFWKQNRKSISGKENIPSFSSLLCLEVSCQDVDQRETAWPRVICSFKRSFFKQKLISFFPPHSLWPWETPSSKIEISKRDWEKRILLGLNSPYVTLAYCLGVCRAFI